MRGSSLPGAPAVLLIALAALLAVPPGALAYDPDYRTTASPSGTFVTISGGVFDAATGAPIPAYVEAWTGDANGSGFSNGTKTDSSGSFSLRLLQGKGWIMVQAADRDAYPAHREELDASASKSVRFALSGYPAKTAVVEGVVTDAATGAPVSGVWVSLGGPYYYATDGGAGSGGSSGASVAPSPPVSYPERCCYGGGESTMTDASGKYRLSSYAGTYQLYLRKDGYRDSSEQVTLVDGTTTTKSVALTAIPPMDAVLTGVVLDRATGKPVAGAQVSVNNVEWGHYATATTGADGRYRLSTYPGYARLDVYAWKQYGGTPVASDAMARGGTEPAIWPGPSGADRNYYAYTDSFRMASGETARDVQITPKPDPTHAVFGYVLDSATKQPIAGAWVSLRNEDTGEFGGAATGADGSYRILARPGWVVVEVGAQDHFGKGASFALVDRETRLDVVLEPGKPQGGCCWAMPMTAEGATDARAYGDKTGAPSAPGTTAATTQRSATGTYSGGAGNLGPFSGEAVTSPKGTAGSSNGSTDKAVVPGPAVFLAAAGAVGAALLLRRRC